MGEQQREPPANAPTRRRAGAGAAATDELLDPVDDVVAVEACAEDEVERPAPITRYAIDVSPERVAGLAGSPDMDGS